MLRTRRVHRSPPVAGLVPLPPILEMRTLRPRKVDGLVQDLQLVGGEAGMESRAVGYMLFRTSLRTNLQLLTCFSFPTFRRLIFFFPSSGCLLPSPYPSLRKDLVSVSYTWIQCMCYLWGRGEALHFQAFSGTLPRYMRRLGRGRVGYSLPSGKLEMSARSCGLHRKLLCPHCLSQPGQLCSSAAGTFPGQPPAHLGQDRSQEPSESGWACMTGLRGWAL